MYKLFVVKVSRYRIDYDNEATSQTTGKFVASTYPSKLGQVALLLLYYDIEN